MPAADIALVAEIAALGVTGQALMAEHPDDGTGHCGSCRGGGDASGRSVWPCSGHKLGERVAELQRHRRKMS